MLIFFSAEWEDFLLSGSLVLRQKVSELAGVYLSFKLNWGKCRSRDLLLFRFAQNGWKVFPLGGLYVSFYLIWGKCRSRDLLLFRFAQNGWKVSPLGGVYLSFELNWEECRRRETLLSIEIQYGKEGLS